MDKEDLLRQIEKHNENKKAEEDNRYKEILKQLNKLSKPKRLEIFVAVIVFLTFLVMLIFQVYLPYRKSLDTATLSVIEKLNSTTQAPELHNAKNPQKSSSITP